ncbi:YdcF family protein [Halobacillus salinarum]|uniref:YdcF family protein n=1 Tax=Halobacillus salinarum TaxID=2932257 RepID=A0ABY4EMZ6_9BACI|nr:YdcF family protein [Halobacillus salinarum]UOQ45559.1 YdcF family protein [Halobacillus salinarum]
MKQTKKILLSFFAVCVLSVILCTATLYILGPNFLLVKGSPKPSDAIILLSGSEDRLELAAQLYSKGYGKKVILTNSTEPATTPEAAMKEGIAKEAILEEPNATSTYENALFARKIMHEHHLKSAVVVTSDYHSRRTRYTFNTIYDDIDVTYAFSDSYFNPDDGLTKQENRTVFQEYVKMIGYAVRFLFTS